MMPTIPTLHPVTATPDVRFFTRALGLRLVKKAALPPAIPEPATRPR
jgi:catechol 2,3-dioxygenase-like lactoylglutathione lyase family enzyme